MTSTYDRLEREIDPPCDADRPAIEAFSAAPARTEEGFPEATLTAVLRGEVGRLMTPAAVGGSLEWHRLMRTCARFAEADLELTLCLGGVMLGALPVVLAGDEAQQRRFFDDVRDGGLAGLGLSEWERGSDLLACDTVARPRKGGFVLDGHKRPTNNGTRGRNLVVLARTGEPGDPFGATAFLLRRPQVGLSGDAPLDWVGNPVRDLSGIVLEGVEVGPEAVLGQVGEGFTLTRRVLETSRSGVACMSVGAHAAAFDLALGHARSRKLYGAPITELPGVRALISRSFGRLQVAIALARRAARGMSGGGARDWSCAAKLLCPALLEESVHECGIVLGTRSLTRESPFWKLRRDAPILGIFDGSSQLMLDEMWRYARAWTHLPGALPEVGEVVREVARRGRSLDQGARFAVSELAAWLYALDAAGEWGAQVRADAGPRLAGLLTGLGAHAIAGAVLNSPKESKTWERLEAW